MIATRADITELTGFIFRNKDCSKEELEKALWEWYKNKMRCGCSRCTGFLDIESYYDDVEEAEGEGE